MSKGKSTPASQQKAQMNDKSNAHNINKGTAGTNITYDRNTSNHAKQVAENAARKAP